jgi:Uncharacterized conserved protein
MAKIKNSSLKVDNNKVNNEEKKGKGVLFTLIAFLTAILIIAIIFGGAFYIVIHNNINGMADKYRKSIQSIPVIKHALPTVPDPLDTQYMTSDEIKNKYEEYKAKVDELTKLLDESQKKQDEFKKYKDEYDAYKAQNDKIAEDLKTRQAALDEKELKLNDLKKKIDELIANGDKEGLKQYFETIDPEIAKQIYTEVVKEQQVSAEAIKFAQIYQAMDASAAAQIFEKLGSSKLELIAETLKTMKKETSAEIMAAMTPEFASKVTVKLKELYSANP